MSRRKTNEEYTAELAIKNPNIESIEEYVDAKTPILHHCKTHDIYWKALPTNILKGRGCCECGKEKNRIRFTKPHEQYVEELKEKNPDVEVIDRYIDIKTPILHLCKIHNIKWKILPSNALNGHGCPKCRIERITESNFKSEEQYINELKEKNPHITSIEHYAGTKTPILHYCKKHNHYWNIAPCNALKGYGCPECSKESHKEKTALSHEEYLEKLSIVNPNIEPIEKYDTARIPITHHCLIHDIYWKIAPSGALQGYGCPKCRNEKIVLHNALTHDEYIEMLKVNNPNVIPVEKYINMKERIDHKCLKHDLIWNTSPASVLQGCGCPKCRSEKISEKLSKTNDEYKKELYNINPNIIPLEEYKGCKVPILHRCLLHNVEWNIAPTDTLSGFGCPKCRETRGERQIRIWLEKDNVEYVFQKRFPDCKDERTLPFDFYIPKYNLCIEYDGLQHFVPVDWFGGEKGFETCQRHDKIKNEYCEKNGILLLRIPYFKNVEEELEQFLFI